MSTMRRTTTGVIGLAVAGTLSLTGCKNGNEEIPAAPSGPASSAPAAPAEQPGSAAPSSPSGYGSSAPAAGAAGQAKSGQTFKLGETATVPFDYGSTKGGTIALTVTAIEQGNPADLDVFKLGDQVKGKVPYYIRYTVKNVGSTDLSFASVGHMKGLLGDGSEAGKLSVIGKFDKCPAESLPKGFTNGQTQTGCAVALAPSAETKVSAAEYWGDPYNSLNKGKGLVWK
ncbi:hypothetical protein HYE82_28190 [Streptomyces sp. BR123]|uniref:hypothetical protein n=1 Tax=Streptomyces sp. BR123 TaxID=2749828 RepID=UPI0015C49DBE|nr:hypothetical protein [Streptomyces sp. BR123]NXY98181.1 hypothetical protein [Streptomyces sp. BR123]